jgi:hypothetical protein
MKTTNEGFLANTLRRLPRHGVKALAAGAVLIAAALPLAVASVAGAAGSISSISICTTSGCNGNGTQASGTSFGTGASGSIAITGAAGSFADDGGNVTVTSNAPGVTFAGASEISDTAATVYFQSSSTTVPGSYSLTLTDDTNAAIVDAGAFTVNPAPTISGVSITTAADNNGVSNYTEVITGTGFVATPAVTFTSESNGTTLNPVTTTWNSATQLTYVFTTQKAVGLANATPGAYDLSVTNGDGGTTTKAAALSVTAAPVSSLNPSALPNIAETASVTVNGLGFEPGAVVTFSCVDITSPSTTFVSATQLTVVFTQATGTQLCNVTVSNPSVINGGNGDVSSLPGGLGLGEASTVAPTVTATSDTTAIVPGSPSGTVTFTGSGLSMFTTAQAFVGATPASGVALSNPSGNTGTSVTYTVTVTSATTTLAGLDAVVLTNTAGPGGSSSPFPAGLTIAGPVITSQSPADIPVGAPAGTIVTLTGTGFTPTLTGSVTAYSVTNLTGNINYVSATTIDLVITGTPTSAGTSASPATVSVSETLVGGSGSAGSVPFKLTAAAGPIVTGIVYAAGTTGVGVGAAAQTITIIGSNFKTGVTVSGFKNANGTADASVTAKVLGINATGTALSVSIAIATGDVNIADGFLVVNTDGGAAAVSATGGYPLVIQSAPTVTSTAPTSASANATTAFTITGTGFAAGATVAATADGTCGAATVASATSITVTCTFGAATATAAALTVTNANGGSATSATVLAATSAPVAPAPHATGEAGDAIIGRTVSIAVAGVGFYGQPSVTSTGNSVKAVVSKDNGTLLTVRVTVGKTTGPGEHTLTFTLANGDVFKANYLIIK